MDAISFIKHYDAITVLKAFISNINSTFQDFSIEPDTLRIIQSLKIVIF